MPVKFARVTFRRYTRMPGAGQAELSVLRRLIRNLSQS